MDPLKTPSQQQESKLHFLDYWRIIRIRKTVILAVFLLVVLTTTAVSFILPQSFMSTARIAVAKDTSDILPLIGIPSQAGFDPFFIQTEFEKIQSQKVLDRVITELGLNDLWKERFGLDQKLKTSETRTLLKKEIELRQARNTSLIEIRVFNPNANEAARIAQKIAEVYQDSRLENMKESSMRGIEALERKLKDQEAEVKTLQARVDELRSQYKISDVDSGTGFAGTTLEPETVRFIERERINAQQQLVQYETLLAELETKNLEELRETLPTAYRDEHLDRLLAGLLEAQQKYTVLSKDYSDTHPEVERVVSLIKEINNQIKLRVGGILSALRTQVAQHRAQFAELTKQVDEAKSRDAENMKNYRDYFQARRDLETKQKIRDNIMFRIIQETVDKELPRTSVVEITDEAEAGLRPVRPNITLNIALGVMVGLIMGVGLAFFIEYLDTSVKTIDDVERALQAPVLGVIPQNVGALIEEGPESPHAEAYRVLRTNVLFSRKDPGAKTLTVVSGGAGEGKSTTIFNLATVFAQSGQRVLIVDSDLRRPSLHKFLNVSNSIGLTNFLLKQNTIEEVIQTTPVPSLHFLPSGKLPSSSMGILNSPQMKEFIQAAKDRYDFVFFDSPPIMGVSDASILASEVDLSLLVVQYRKYPQAMTMRAKQMVEKVGGTLLGVVLNNINISQDSYYYYYSGYYYDYYSKHDEEGGTSKKNGEMTTAAADRGASVDLKKKY